MGTQNLSSQTQHFRTKNKPTDVLKSLLNDVVFSTDNSLKHMIKNFIHPFFWGNLQYIEETHHISDTTAYLYYGSWTIVRNQ